MQLTETSIRRPVFACVLSLLIILVGLVAWSRLTVREYPKTEDPVVSVQTDFPGASSEVVESQLTGVLENALAGLEGVNFISSTSKQGKSQITIYFKSGRNADAAASDVSSRVAAARKRLPADVKDPIVSKSDADADPVLILALSSEQYTPMELSQMADLQIKPELQNATGVADVFIWGEKKPTMQVMLHPEKMAGYGLTTQDIAAALTNANIQLPAGRIQGPNREFEIAAQTGLVTADQFKHIVLRNVKGSFVRLQDVATVKEEPQEARMSAKLNGKPVVAIALTKQATANPLELSKSVTSLLPNIEKGLPKNVHLEVAEDTSVAIGASIDAVFHTIGEAVALVAIVVLIFLRTLRASIIPLVTIPVSLLGTFALMLAMGFSINLLTLLALVLAVGLVVDDSIVVLENIYRHIEDGMPPFQAAITGAREVGFAVIAMTLTLVAVYAPLGFTPGSTGKLFVEFAFSLAGAVVISGFVALTLSPMMSSLLLKHNSQPSRIEQILERCLNHLVELYRRMLAKTLQHRWVVVTVMLVAAGLALALLRTLPSELAPTEDQNYFMVSLQAPEGSSLAYTSHYTSEVEKIIRKMPNIESVFSVVGMPNVSSSMLFAEAMPSQDRKESVMDMARKLNIQIARLPAVQAFAMVPPALSNGHGSGRPLSFVILTNDGYPQLNTVVEKFIAAIKKNPKLLQVQSNLRMNQPELKLSVNREMAANLDVNIADVARSVQTMIGGSTINTYESGGKQYDVMMQVPPLDRNQPSDIDGLYLRNASGSMVPLSSLTSLREDVTAPQLNHFNQRRAAIISASLSPDYSLGQALQYMQETAQKVLPAGYSTNLKGTSREFASTQGSMQLIFTLALLFIFLVLSAQFESFIDPFVIMLSVPLSLAGALLTLKLTGGSLNIYSEIGMVTLIGLITKHGILIVEFANQLREQGLSVLDAVIQSAAQRFRPILMTTGAMVLGSIPLALADGPGAMSRQQIGWVIVGGMSIGTLFTIFVVPTVYTLLARSTVPGAIKTEIEDRTHGDNKLS